MVQTMFLSSFRRDSGHSCLQASFLISRPSVRFLLANILVEWIHCWLAVCPVSLSAVHSLVNPLLLEESQSSQSVSLLSVSQTKRENKNFLDSFVVFGYQRLRVNHVPFFCFEGKSSG